MAQARFVVAAVVEDNEDNRDVVAGSRPQRFELTEHDGELSTDSAAVNVKPAAAMPLRKDLRDKSRLR